MSIFMNRLRLERKRRDLSQAKLADKADVNQADVSQIENGVVTSQVAADRLKDYLKLNEESDLTEQIELEEVA